MSIEDRAQDHEATEWAARNAPRASAAQFAPEDAGYGPKYCEECGSTMPVLRRQHGWRLCTSCQGHVERGRLKR
jgi:RNA polymerase-binding transcription factor DksA